VSTFLGWYPVLEGAYFNRSSGDSVFVGTTPALNAWEAFSVIDLVLAVVVAIGAWAAATLVRGRARQLAGGTALAAAVVGFGLVIWRTVDDPVALGTGVGVGAVLAACALLTIAGGGALAVAGRR
jgi:hypothetical protein